MTSKTKLTDVARRNLIHETITRMQRLVQLSGTAQRTAGGYPEWAALTDNDVLNLWVDTDTACKALLPKED